MVRQTQCSLSLWISKNNVLNQQITCEMTMAKIKQSANQFRLLLSSSAYVLVDTIRRVGLRGSEAARW